MTILHWTMLKLGSHVNHVFTTNISICYLQYALYVFRLICKDALVTCEAIFLSLEQTNCEYQN